MKKVKILLLLGVVFFINKSQAQKTVYDANAQVRNVGSFTGISVSSAIDLYISMGSEDAVAVSGSDKAYTDAITTEVKNGMLYIGYKSGGVNWGAKSMKAYVSIKSITKLVASGASDVYVDGSLKATDLSIELSGASDFKGEVNAQNLRLKASGSSDFTISGKASNVKIEVHGSSDVKAFDLITDNCDVEASGSSDVNITVNKQLKATASGSSDIRYKGEATVKEVSSSGSSDIKKVKG
jgi:Putative auto-transporter adhesin, head GIN domain